MKKFVAVMLSLMLIAVLSAACASDTETPPEGTPDATPSPTPQDTPPPPAEPVDKEFSAEGLAITLTDSFEQAGSGVDGFTTTYKSDSDNALVTVVKEEFASEMSLKDYAQSVIDAGGYNCRVEEISGITHFVYDDGDDSVYAVVYRSDGAYWTIRFSTPTANYLRLQERFKAWAQSIDVGAGPGLSVLPDGQVRPGDPVYVYYYDTYGDISSEPSIMWGDKGWGGWNKHALIDNGDGWYSFDIKTADITASYNMLIFFNGLPDSDPDAIQWVWHIDRGAPNGLYFVADMANDLNPPANDYQGWQRDCNSYATLEEANEAIASLS